MYRLSVPVRVGRDLSYHKLDMKFGKCWIYGGRGVISEVDALLMGCYVWIPKMQGTSYEVGAQDLNYVVNTLISRYMLCYHP